MANGDNINLTAYGTWKFRLCYSVSSNENKGAAITNRNVRGSQAAGGRRFARSIDGWRTTHPIQIHLFSHSVRPVEHPRQIFE
jgi:hypothetical protein